MSTLLHEWKNTFYTELVLFFTLLLTLSVAIIKRRKIPALNLLPWYLTSFIVLLSTSYYNASVNSGKMNNAIFGSLWSQEYIVGIIEFLTFTIFLTRISTIKDHRRILKFLTLAMPVIFISTYVHSYLRPEIEKYYLLHILYGIENLLLLAGCVLYYIGILKNPAGENLFNNASFWVVSGLSFYCICTLPVTLISPELIEYNRDLYFKIFSAIYIFYIILFLMIMRAYYARGTA